MQPQGRGPAAHSGAAGHSAGVPPVASVWLWHAGARPASLARPFPDSLMRATKLRFNLTRARACVMPQLIFNYTVRGYWCFSIDLFFDSSALSTLSLLHLLSQSPPHASPALPGSFPFSESSACVSKMHWYKLILGTRGRITSDHSACGLRSSLSNNGRPARSTLFI